MSELSSGYEEFKASVTASLKAIEDRLEDLANNAPTPTEGPEPTEEPATTQAPPAPSRRRIKGVTPHHWVAHGAAIGKTRNCPAAAGFGKCKDGSDCGYMFGTLDSCKKKCASLSTCTGFSRYGYFQEGMVGGSANPYVFA